MVASKTLTAEYSRPFCIMNIHSINLVCCTEVGRYLLTKYIPMMLQTTAVMDVFQDTSYPDNWCNVMFLFI